MAAGRFWVIIGGESGPGDIVRPCHIEQVRALVQECLRSGAPVFVKQLGSLPTSRESTGPQWAAGRLTLLDKKGGDMVEWPEDLRVRQLPEGYHVSAFAQKEEGDLP